MIETEGKPVQEPKLGTAEGFAASGIFIGLLALLASAVVGIVQANGDYTALDSLLAAFLMAVALNFRKNVPGEFFARWSYFLILGLAGSLALAPFTILSAGNCPTDQVKDAIVAGVAVVGMLVARVSSVDSN